MREPGKPAVCPNCGLENVRPEVGAGGRGLGAGETAMRAPAEEQAVRPALKARKRWRSMGSGGSTRTRWRYPSTPGTLIGTMISPTNAGDSVAIPTTLLAGNVAGRQWYLAAGVNGAACDGTTDDTAALNAILAHPSGGVVVVVGTCKISSAAITIPYTGGPTLYSQPSWRITGFGSSANGQWRALPTSPSALDLQYNASVAKIDTRAPGLLEIDHLNLIDTSSDCATFVSTIMTTLNIHDTGFVGTHSGVDACNIGISLSGDGSGTGVQPTAGSQAYGTKIDHNFFSKISAGVRLLRDIDAARRESCSTGRWGVRCFRKPDSV
jgi:hypothetical protein